MTAEQILLGALFFAAAGAGWVAARLSAAARPSEGATTPSADYFRGLDHVLRDESDKALGVLQGLAEADPGVVEIHFALATLFRRRGETDRAIRIHQDLLGRPNLARAHREQATFDLAEDYYSAGLYDRAEALYQQLVAQNAFRARALARLVAIYERQRDWEQAIAARRELAAMVPGDHAGIIAQYCCEQARQACQSNDLASMRTALRRARDADENIVRGALMRADLALLRADKPLALRLYGRVLAQEPSLALVVMERLSDCATAGADEIDEVLAQATRRNRGLTPHLGRAVLASTAAANTQVGAAAARDLLAAEPALAALTGSEQDLEPARKALHTLGLALPEYQCEQCGYRALELHWQCPACSGWDTSRPDIRLKAASGPA